MSFFEFPNTRTYDKDLGWVIKAMKELSDIVENFVYTSTLKFADPIMWNITTQYEKSTIVLDPSGNAYLSKDAVPSGIQLDNTDYWLEIFNFTDYTRTANKNLTINVETNTTRATAPYVVDDWLIWNDILYKVTSAIAIDDTFIVAPDAGANIIHFTVEEFCKTWLSTLQNMYDSFVETQERNFDNFVDDTTDQIDRLIAGATTATEIVDAREEYDGYISTTLKNAIHDTANNLGVGIESARAVVDIPVDLFDTSDPDYLVGYGYDGTTGTIVASATANITGYIPMTYGDKIGFYWRYNAVFMDALNETGKYALYDHDKNWIKTVNFHNVPLSTPEYMAEFDGYIRIMFLNTRTVTDYHLYNNKVGNTQRPYFDYLPAARRGYEHASYTPIAAKWAYGAIGSSGGNPTNTRGKKRAFVLLDDIPDGSIIAFKRNKYSVFWRLFSYDMTTQLATSGNAASGGIINFTNNGYPLGTYKAYIQIDRVDSGDIDLYDLANEIGIYYKPQIVDLMIFSGQSNMAGRGASSSGVNRCAGYEFRAITDPSRLYPITDPFGVNENVSGAIDDGNNKTGSCVPYFVNAYYDTTGVTTVAISASDGATGIDDWQKDGARYDDMYQRYLDCVAYLTAHDYQIRNKYLIWHQGEHDSQMSVADYKAKFLQFAADARADMDLNEIAIIRVGQSTSYPNANIIEAQTQICNAFNPNHTIMLYTNCAAFEALGLLKNDDLHYNQNGLNDMGRASGNNLGFYVNNRNKPLMYDPYYDNIYIAKRNS